MQKTIDELIMLALQGIPVSGLVENWTFTINEIAPYIFEAKGIDMNGRTVTGYGETAKLALQISIKKIERLEHPFRGCNIIWLLAWKIVDIVGLAIRKIRGIDD
jgi:hypothetical protein